MPAELCRITTADGYFLDGILRRPNRPRSNLGVDAFLLIHGTGSNFLAPGVLAVFAEQAIQAGVAVLRINTRGHDGMARIAGIRGSIDGGAAFETVSDCREDVGACLINLLARGFSRIGLVGHSMGGVKAIYAMAHDRHPTVACVIGISPPRFCYANFLKHARADVFRADFRRAQAMVAADQGDELLYVKQPLPMWLTAAGYLAKYGPDDEYDVVRHLPQLTVPTLILVGTESVRTSPAFDGLPQEIERLAAEHKHLSLRVVEGADTNYSTCLTTPFTLAAAWLNQRLNVQS
jgi:alpha-beta hydrolase superfamily lysophospholipase